MLNQISIPEITREKIEAVRDIVLKQCDQAHSKMTGNCKDYYSDGFSDCQIDFNQGGFTPAELSQALKYENLRAQAEILDKVIYNRFYYEPLDTCPGDCNECNIDCEDKNKPVDPTEECGGVNLFER